MGGTTYSHDDYNSRSATRSSTAAAKGISITSASFAHDHAIKTGATKAGVHPTLNPKGVKVRDSRDSDAHPVTVPIIVGLDTTGSMQSVPVTIQSKLNKLMGSFLDDKASGKRYLGEGYPAIMIAAVDDYNAMSSAGDDSGEGCLQVGQFESGIEIDDNLTSLWLTGNGGGTYHEQYDLLLYFAARHTVHDHYEKRGRKGYLFIIGDEHAYPYVERDVVKNVIGAKLQANIALAEIVKEVKQRYHVFFIIPGHTQHYNDRNLEKYWVDLLGQQNVIKLADPEKICETIVAAVAICEEHIGIDDLQADLGADLGALVPLHKAGLTKHSAAGLPAVAGGIDRL